VHADIETLTGPYAVLNGVLDELVDCGAVTPAHRQGADVACWAIVHGFASLLIEGPLREVPHEMRAPLLESVLDVVHRGLFA
jgi:hypothetical protein